MSYLDFFNLQIEPFSNAPNERFYYNSAQHARALTRIMYVAETMKGLAVVVGDVGTGKTTLARKVLDSLPVEAYESALLVILHAEITQEWLLRKIASQLGVEQTSGEKLQTIGHLYRRLLHLHEMGKKAVVLIDEAQMLNTRGLMEEFRGLLNLEVTAHKLITFVFFGLPEIEQNLVLDPPLLQRVSMKIRLSTLTEEATKAYIQHRLNVAGGREQMLTPEAFREIYRFSGGFPRKINVLTDNSLFQAFLMRKRIVDGEIVREMASDLGFDVQMEAHARIPSLDLPASWGGGPQETAAPASAAGLPDAAVQKEGQDAPDPQRGASAGVPAPRDELDVRLEEFFEDTFKQKS